MASIHVWMSYLAVVCFMVVPNWSLEQDKMEDFYEETVVLKTKSGSLRGQKEVVDFKTSYYAFKGIKYAKAPTGERRFQVLIFGYSWLLTDSSFLTYYSISPRKQRNLGWVFAMP